VVPSCSSCCLRLNSPSFHPTTLSHISQVSTQSSLLNTAPYGNV
jgi:hypothetical protein